MTDSALTIRRDDDFRLALEPSNLESAFKLAAIVAKTGLYGCKSPEDALLRILTGRALGVAAPVALQNIYDVYGRPSISSRLKTALVLRHPDCEYFEHVESSTESCTYRCKRRGREEKRVTFSLADAQRAQLVKKDSNWDKWPRRMLQARAASELVDLEFPDVCMGFPSEEDSRDAHAIADLEFPEVEAAVDCDTAQTPAPPAQAPARDWESEATLLKQLIADAKGDEVKNIREAAAEFAKEAPEALVTEIRNLYNLVHGKGGKSRE
jgi:hypothetical protein